MSAAESFEKSFEFFSKNKESIYKEYKNKVVVVYIDGVLGEYPSKHDAYLNAPKDHDVEPGSFVIQDCSQTMQTPRVYHSRVEF